MTSWNDLTAEQRTLITQACTPKELEAWKLSLGGAGYRKISAALGIAPETARARIRNARRKIGEAILQQGDAA